MMVHKCAIRIFVAPGPFTCVDRPTICLFPLSFRRQPLPLPRTVVHRLLPGDIEHRGARHRSDCRNSLYGVRDRLFEGAAQAPAETQARYSRFVTSYLSIPVTVQLDHVGGEIRRQSTLPSTLSPSQPIRKSPAGIVTMLPNTGFSVTASVSKRQTGPRVRFPLPSVASTRQKYVVPLSSVPTGSSAA